MATDPGEPILQILMKNFKCHVDACFSFSMGQLQLLNGNSGKGKSTIPRAIQWCLYANERNVGNFFNKNSATSVTVFTDTWEVKRVTKPMRVTATCDGELFTGMAALDWISRRFGTCSVWSLSCLQRLSAPNVLVQSDKKERALVFRELAFSSENSEECINQIVKHISTEEERSKQSTVLVTSLMQNLQRSGANRENPLLQKSVAELKQGLELVDQAIQDVETTRALLTAAEKNQNALRYTLERDAGDHAEHAEIMNQLSSDEIVGYGGSIQQDPAGEWDAVTRELRVYQQKLHAYFANSTDERVLDAELKETLEEFGINESALVDLPSLKMNQVHVDRYSRQDELCQQLGVPRNGDLTEAMWDSICGDVNIWNAQSPLLLQWKDEIQTQEREGDVLKEQILSHALPESLTNFEMAAIETYRNETVAMVKALESVKVESWSDTLIEDLGQRAAAIKEVQNSHDHATRWERARSIFAEYQKYNSKNPDEAAMERITAQIFESSMESLHCPSCNTEVLLKSGALQVKRHASTTSIDTLRMQLDEMKKAKVQYDYCQQLLADVRKIEVKAEYKASKVIDPHELECLNAEAHTIREVIRNYDVILSMSSSTRRWLFQSFLHYRDAIAAIVVFRSKKSALDATASKLGRLFGDTTRSLDDVFVTFWQHDNVRTVNQTTRSTITGLKRTPAYVQRPNMCMETLRNALLCVDMKRKIDEARRLRELASQVAPPEIALPSFPEFPYLAAEYFSDLSTMIAINKAVEKLSFICNTVRDRHNLYMRWTRARHGFVRYEEASAVLPGMITQINTLKNQLQTATGVAAEQKALSEALPARVTLDQICEAEELTAASAENIKNLRKFLEIAHFRDAKMLQDSMKILTGHVNEVLAGLFSTPAVIEITGFKTTKMSKTTKVDHAILFHFKGTIYEDLGTLSDGEFARLSMALSIAASRMNPFPLFFMDESLATLQPDLRMEAMELVRRYLLPDKGVVVILQEDTIGTFDTIQTLV